jgi:hypothetical protein
MSVDKRLTALLKISMVIGLIAAGCRDGTINARPSVPLINGYEAVPISGDTWAITDSQRRNAVSESVITLAVVGDLIIGQSVIPSPPSPMMQYSPGYFVLNSRTGETVEGLDRATWRKKLRELGITDEPKLRRFSRFFRP